MEWGFGLAIVGIIIILISTIWYFATQSMTFFSIAASGDNPVKGADGKPLTRTTNGTTVTLTGNNILLVETTPLVGTSPVAIGGWVIGSLMVIGGTIWGVIAKSRAKPESKTAQLLNLLALTTPPASATAVVTPPPPRTVVPSGLSAEELAKLRAILNASA